MEVLKTYKFYVGGKFIRSESGRHFPFTVGQKHVANVCLASKKDFRDSVLAAKSGLKSWATATAFNRSQILYRLAEMLQGRSVQMEEELVACGAKKTEAKKDIEASINLIVHYAGWCDKFQQIASSVNPVSSSHFNFSVYEPMGVIAILDSDSKTLSQVLQMVLPIIVGGNSCILHVHESMALPMLTFAEVVHTSDVPSGTINILAGPQTDYHKHMASHMEIAAMCLLNDNEQVIKETEIAACENLKRLISPILLKKGGPLAITNSMELKTTWHPISTSAGSASAY